MRIGRCEIPRTYMAASAAGLTLLGAAALGVERAVDGDTGTQRRTTVESSAPAEKPEPTPTKTELGCTGLIGKVKVIYPSGKDPAFVRIESVVPSGTKNGQEDCATVYNPNNIAEELAIVSAGEELFACREDKPARLEISIPWDNTGYVQGAVNLTGDLKHQMPEGQISDCADIGWKPNGEVKPPESLLNDTPFYEPKYGESVPTYGKPVACEDVFGNVNWQDPTCAALMQN